VKLNLSWLPSKTAFSRVKSYSLLEICTTYCHIMLIREDVFPKPLRNTRFADT
jgi:hypothetical protein